MDPELQQGGLINAEMLFIPVENSGGRPPAVHEFAFFNGQEFGIRMPGIQGADAGHAPVSEQIEVVLLRFQRQAGTGSGRLAGNGKGRADGDRAEAHLVFLRPFMNHGLKPRCSVRGGQQRNHLTEQPVDPGVGVPVHQAAEGGVACVHADRGTQRGIRETANVLDAKGRKAQGVMMSDGIDQPGGGAAVEGGLRNEKRIVQLGIGIAGSAEIGHVDIGSKPVDGGSRGLPDFHHPVHGASAWILSGLQPLNKPAVDIHGKRILRLAGGGHRLHMLRGVPGHEHFIGRGSEDLSPGFAGAAGEGFTQIRSQ